MATVQAIRSAAAGSAGGRVPSLVARRALLTSCRAGPRRLLLQQQQRQRHVSSSSRDAVFKRNSATNPGPTSGGACGRRTYLAPALACPLLATLAELDRRAQCEGAVLVTRSTRMRLLSHDEEVDPELNDLLKRLRKLRRKARRALRMVARAAQLLLTFAPLAALYPVARILRSFGLGGGSGREAEDLARALGDAPISDSAVADWYLRMCLWCVESSGAAVIKLMQWASSRPDMFGERFCEVFGALQDSTTPHAWRHTEETLRQNYGEGWEERIRMGKILGSGCIGQVYAGTVTHGDGMEQEVAVKVMHPGVKNNIDADLDLLAFFANIAEHAPFGIGKQLVWLDLPGVVQEFHTLLIHQLDFRTEAENLERFNYNFRHDDEVLFPELIDGFPAKAEILVESFCDGIPFWQWNRENMKNVEVRNNMCNIGVRTVCQMIFKDNFIHQDLHPGNIFCSRDGKKFILLDTGMASEYDDDDHDRIISILTAFIRMDGEKAGELLIKDSNARTRDEDKVLHEQEYIAKIKQLTDECKYNEDQYLMQRLGEYIGRMFDAAQKHHVLMNPAFVSCSLAVKVVEGVALALNPDCEIWRIANPIILASEIARNTKKLGNTFGVSSIAAKIRGEAELMVKRVKYLGIDAGKHNPKREE